VTIALNSVGDKTEPWADDNYVGGMYYSQCGSLANSYSKLRCRKYTKEKLFLLCANRNIELIDATYIALIVSVVAWVVAIFGRKGTVKDVNKPDIERPPITTDDSTLTIPTEKRSSKPPKQKPVVTKIDEEEEKRRMSLTTEKSRLLVTTTKTRQSTLPVEKKEDDASDDTKKASSTENLPLSIHDDSIQPLGGLNVAVERPMKYGRRSSTLNSDQSLTLTKVDSSTSLKKDLEHINEE
jgi:hypothetical protein